jgi:hypothetical protein
MLGEISGKSETFRSGGDVECTDDGAGWYDSLIAGNYTVHNHQT